MENNANSNTKMIYCQPSSEYYWKVCINSLESPSYMEKEDLYNYLYTMIKSKETIEQFTFMIQRFFPFVYDVEEGVLYELHKEDGEAVLENVISKLAYSEQSKEEKNILNTIDTFKVGSFREKMNNFVKKMKKV